MDLKSLNPFKKKEPKVIVLDNLEGLLDFLELRFPDNLPRTPDISIENVRILQGSRMVVDYIRDVIGSGRLDDK